MIEHIPHEVRLFRALAAPFAHQAHEFNSANMLERLRLRKPDLYVTLMNYNGGLDWFDRQIKEIANLLWR
jgi:hypothetical protein